MKNKILFIIILNLLGVISFTQTTFNKAFFFDESAVIFGGVVATDSCYYVSGIIGPSYNIFDSGSIFLKIDLEGEVEIKKILIDSFNVDIEPWRATLNPLEDGNFLLSATVIDSFLNSGIIKYNALGDTLFLKKYGHPYDAPSFIVPIDMITDSLGNIYLGSNINDENHLTNIDLMKVDSVGNQLWRYQYGMPSKRVPIKSLVLKENGNIIIGSQIRNLGSNDFQHQNYIFEINNAGQILWEYKSPLWRLFGGVNHILLTEDGGMVCASKENSEHVINQSGSLVRGLPYIFKLDANRQLEWEFKVEEETEGQLDNLEKVILAPDGQGYVAAGSMGDYTGDTYSRYKGWLGKFSLEGDSLWGRFQSFVFDSVGNDYLYDFQATPDSGFVMVGQSHIAEIPGQANTTQQHGWIIKVDKHGCLVPGCHLETNITEIENYQFELKLFPNPATDFLNVFFRNKRNQDNFQFEIRDISGKLIQSFENNFREETLMLPVWNYPKGMYFLSLMAKGKVLKTEKFFVQ